MTVTPDFWSDLRALGEVVGGPLLVLATIWAVALWREHHHDKEETDQ
jgi:hypothetical protein